MNRLGTALLAAIEAVVTVGVGLGIALVPLTLLWGFQYGLQVDWDVFWKAAGSVWLIGHGVDVTFTLGSAAAEAAGVSGGVAPITVTLAALGFAVVTAWLGGRAGRRFAETEHRVTGLLVGTAVTALLGLAVALSSTSAATAPVVWQAVVAPALWFGIPAVAAAEVCRRRRGLAADPLTEGVTGLFDRVPSPWRAVAAFGLRAGTTATAAVVAAAALLVGFLLLGSFAEVITLYERTHAGLVGGVALTVGQLAFVPDLVAWATAWLVGPGFAIGTGSTVSPLGTTLGPIPAVPVLGALPVGGHTFGLVWVLVPVVAGFAVGGLMRPRLVRALGSADTALHRALGGVATGIVAGVLTGVVTALASGSLGPGRLTDVGPDGLVVGAFAALEVGVPAVIALAVGSDLVRLPERSWVGERWHEAEDDVATAASTPEHGSLIATLDRAGAGRTTEVHRFVVAEEHDAVTTASPRRPVDSRSSSAATTDAGARTPALERTDPHTASTPATDAAGTTATGAAGSDATDAAGTAATDVELPAWARTDAVAADRLDAAPDGAGAEHGLRSRIRSAASGARDRVEELRGRAGQVAERAGDRAGGLRDRAGDRAGSLRDRLRGGGTGPDVHQQGGGARPAADPAETQQPAFPWSTAEFVAGRDDVDDVPSTPADPGPATSTPAQPAGTTWDSTDQIPEDELPWWRHPKGDR
jgi:hypothetical protein